MAHEPPSLDHIWQRLVSSPLTHLGPTAHGWTTMHPQECDLCWVVDALKREEEAHDA